MNWRSQFLWIFQIRIHTGSLSVPRNGTQNWLRLTWLDVQIHMFETGNFRTLSTSTSSSWKQQESVPKPIFKCCGHSLTASYVVVSPANIGYRNYTSYCQRWGNRRELNPTNMWGFRRSMYSSCCSLTVVFAFNSPAHSACFIQQTLSGFIAMQAIIT